VDSDALTRRVAYADPPYPGRSSRFYADQPDYEGEVDHAALICERLGLYDGWLLQTSTALRDLLPLCPPDTRVMAWCKPWASFKGPAAAGERTAYAWEPILVRPVRSPRKARGSVLRDYLVASITTGEGLAGAKPAAVIRYGFLVLGLEPGDELCDLFPGTGAVGREWDRWRHELRLDVSPAEDP
jgi:hypothetical protein